MAFSRSLLIKGIAGGLGACTACAGGVGIYKSVSSSVTDKQLIEKAGLECGLDGDELTGTDSKDCTVKTNEKINVKQGSQKEEGVSFTNEGTTKLKVSKSLEGNYSNGLKFVVDSGDITLTRNGGTNPTITTLGQYETYGIVNEGGKYYLTRKTEAKEEKEKALGLFGKCEFPASGNKNCSFNTEEIKKVKFDGAGDEGVTVTGESVSLKITKVTGTDPFTDSLRFTFTFPSDVTISTDNSVKANTPTDFKIKKGNGNDLSLEKAWSDDNAFTKKAGLDCSSNSGNECTIASGGTPSTLSVKVGDKKKEGINSLGNGGGKIKLDKDQAGYNQGFKFTIINSPITLSGGNGDANINKLEQFETYEITEDGDKYYLTRKTGPEGDIKTSLGLPCDLPAEGSVNCEVQAAQSKGVKFDQKEDQKPTVPLTLKIEKTGDSSFPFGYKFTLVSTSDVEFSGSDTVKANTNTVFKIKKTADSNDISLEKAWENTKFSEKIGLECTGSNGECCSKTGSEKLNVKRGNDKKEDITSISTDAGKIKVEKDQAGYNQGLKFTIIGGDVTLTDGNVVSGNIEKLEELETYEITEEGGKYYLTRKEEANKTIKDSLGLPCDLPTEGSIECSITEQAKNIKFDGKDKGKPTGEIKLKIEKTNDNNFPKGYKFTLVSESDVALSSTSTIKSNTNTEFKIKRETSSSGISLEKAWSNVNDLVGKIGLECTGSNGKECSTKSSSSEKLNVKVGDKKNEGVTSLTMGSGKIKLEKEQAGYNQGLKFTITGGDVTLNGGNGNVEKLEEFETYEIKEVGDSWYLARKDKAEVFIKKALNIEEFCTGSFPTSDAPYTCNNIKEVSKLQNIKFDNKDSFSSSWPKGNIEIQLEINKNTSLPGGFRFTFNGCSSPSCCLPGSSKAEADKNGGINYMIKRDTTNPGTICLEPKSGTGSTGGKCTN